MKTHNIDGYSRSRFHPRLKPITIVGSRPLFLGLSQEVPEYSAIRLSETLEHAGVR